MLQIYEVAPDYIDYLIPYAPHLFHNAQEGQRNTRKYIGIVLTVNDMNYFVPLSSLKSKHKRMVGAVDLLIIGKYAVLNMNTMFPVPDGCYRGVIFSEVQDKKYRALLRTEYRIIKTIEKKINKTARFIYEHKMRSKTGNPLSDRTNDFEMLEELCRNYIKV